MEVFKRGTGFGLSSAERHLAREKRAISQEMPRRITGKMPVPRYFDGLDNRLVAPPTSAKRLVFHHSSGVSVNQYSQWVPAMATDDKQAEFLRSQTAYFRDADTRRFLWMTQNPYFSSEEKQLLGLLNQLQPSRLLEVGCGEGANLFNLDYQPPLAVGIDLFEERCRFAQRQCPAARFICSDAYQLPMRSNSFDLVFCRDLLHHVLDKKRLLQEMIRACRLNGRVACIEACGRNPVIATFAMAVRAERGLLRCNASVFVALFREAGLVDVGIQMYQPMPVHRVILHPSYGFPSLGVRRWYRAWAKPFDRLCARIVPKRYWAYAVVSGRKPA
jgi:SAM-dependent methyltransferase